MLARWVFNGEELILRMCAAAVMAFLIVVLLLPKLISYLRKREFGDRPDFDHSGLNKLNEGKTGTPTMGGIVIVGAILAATLFFADIQKMYIRMAFLVMIWLGALGAVDDLIKIRKARRRALGADIKDRDGLKSYQKILFQIALAVILSFFIQQHGSEGLYRDFDGRLINAMDNFYFPFRAAPVSLSLAAFVIITVLVMVGSSNAVNLTDGMDGLAGGCMVIVTGVFLVLSWVAGVQQWANQFRLPCVPEASELTVLCAAIAGACVGFLWYNCAPAQIFMGDTGSLPLGGLIGYIAVVTRHELMLFIAGGVFVIEALSVVIQVAYYKATKGKRVFLCAPIHHHFHLAGWAESKVVVRFWLLTILCAAVAMATLQLR